MHLPLRMSVQLGAGQRARVHCTMRGAAGRLTGRLFGRVGSRLTRGLGAPGVAEVGLERLRGVQVTPPRLRDAAVSTRQPLGQRRVDLMGAWQRTPVGVRPLNRRQRKGHPVAGSIV